MNTSRIFVWLGGPVTFEATRENLKAEGPYNGPGFYEIHDHKITRRTH